MFVFTMKAILLTTILLVTTTLPILAQQAIELTIVVKGFKSTAGTVKLQLVDADNKEMITHVSPLTSTTYTITLNVYKAGKYAVNILHDKNNNNKLDTNILGIPKEGWGCSNNARGVMSAPKFKDKLIDLSTNKTITINLVHY